MTAATAGRITTAITIVEPGLRALVGQFRRVLNDQDGSVDCGKAGAGGLEMALKDRAFVNFGIRQEAVGGLGVGPVLARQRKATSDGTGHVG